MGAVYILGGSVTGGAGVGDNTSLAWPNLLGRDVVVYFKNAIDPSYFLHCSARFSTPKEPATAVLLDLCPNMWSVGASDDLERLVYDAVRRTRATRVGLIAWPRRGNARHDVDALVRVSRGTRADVIYVAHNRTFYADAVHPNIESHRQIATRVLEFLNSPSRGVVKLRRTQPPVYHEVCYSDARNIPIAWNRGWNLVDEGRAKRPKYGWAPNNSSESKQLAFVVPSSAGCAAVVTLGFLRSNTTGIFRLQCIGCKCSTHRGYYQHLNPFPKVNTQISEPLRVTSTTHFDVARTPNRACIVEVEARSRVRIDSVSVRNRTADDVRNARLSRQRQHAWFANWSDTCGD